MSDAPPGAHAGGPELPLIEQIENEIRSGQIELPVLPESAQRVREMIAREERLSGIVAVIEREPPLAATLLRYANSIAFAGLSGVADLNQAVTRLGMRATEHTVMAVTLRNLFSSPDAADTARLKALWEHSLAVALGARRVATIVRGVSPEMAFLTGLMHDVGKVLVLRTVARIKQRDPKRRLSDTGLEALFASLNAPVGERLVEAWGLHEDVRAVVGRREGSALTVADPPLAGILALAHTIVERLDTGAGVDDAAELAALPAAVALDLGEGDLAEMIAALATDLGQAETTFLAA